MRPVLFLVVAAAAGACQQDPLRIRTLGDAAGSDGLSPDAAIPVGDGPRAEAKAPPRKDLSYDACRAVPEACNNLDDNCNGSIDEGFDKQNDARYCEGCKGCAFLLTSHAVPGCKLGACVVQTCLADPVTGQAYFDLDKDVKNGCEYACTPSGLEVCDGKDNDCNGQVDEGVVAPVGSYCKTLGPCAGSALGCKGEQGWQCQYDLAKGVELQPCTQDSECGGGYRCDTTKGVCPGVVIGNEEVCDGVDGNCDGIADEVWSQVVHPTLTSALDRECDLEAPPKKGICRNVGRYACEPVTKDKTVCTVIDCLLDTDCPGGKCLGGKCKPVLAVDELCNGLDDDCDGLVDEPVDDAAGKGVKDTMVHVQRAGQSFYIFSYEASRPDATQGSAGARTARACSKAGVMPWASVAYAEAAAACTAAGRRLCTKAEWVAACQGAAGSAYPYGATYQPQSCNGFDHATGAPVPTGSMALCQGGEPSLFDMSGNLREWTSEQQGTTGSLPIYVVRGGAFHTPAPGLTCAFSLSLAVSDVALPAIGFRCCSNGP